MDPTPALAELSIKILARRHPLAHLRRPPSGQYNCHGLTFANRRVRVFANDDVMAILSDDGYRRVPAKDVSVGDVIVYYDAKDEISHTGIVIRVSPPDLSRGIFRAIDIMSKWGDQGEYIHPASHAPAEYGKRMQYWTDRE